MTKMALHTHINYLHYDHWADWHVASGSLLLYDDPVLTLASLKARSTLFPSAYD